MTWYRYLMYALSAVVTFCSITEKLKAQPCDPGVPSYTVDLSGDPSGVWNSPIITRSNQCCGVASNRSCVEFILTLHPDAIGFSIDVTSGSISNGSDFFQVDCGPQYTFSESICVSGTGPFSITFCKPGNNTHTFKFSSIYAELQTPTITTNEGCTQTLSIAGDFDPSTIIWRDITGGGIYDAYLDCTTGCPVVNVTPFDLGGGIPAYVDYEVCVWANSICVSTLPPVCKVARVIIVPYIDISIDDVLICPDEYPYTITANISPPGSYDYYWYDGPNETGNIIASGTDITSINVSSPGSYSVAVEVPNYGICSRNSTSFDVTTKPVPGATIIGPTTICPNETFQYEANNEGPGVTYSWDFGSGSSPSTATGRGPHNVQFNNCTSRTITLTTELDGCQNTTTLNVGPDNIIPTLDLKPADITVDCSNVPPAPSITASDNCDSNVDVNMVQTIVNQVCTGTYEINREWIATDNCANIDYHQQTITVQDIIPPTFTIPADVTLYSDINCNYNAPISLTGDVTDENDNCDPSVDATFVDNVNTGSCAGEIIISRIWSLSNNAAPNQIQTIATMRHQTKFKRTILDNIPPTFSAPSDVTINADANCNYNDSPSNTGSPFNINDNCDNNLAPTFSDATAPGSCEGEVIITRTWSLVDDCGNAAPNQTQTITVQDNTPPTFSAPADITIFADANCNYDASVSATGDVTDENDNCTSTLNATFSDATAPGTCEGEVIIIG